MNTTEPAAPDTKPNAPTAAEASEPRKRPPRGERRIQILQTLARMLEEPQGERITTALLAKRIGFSEAALYRHFTGKAQMLEALIEFIETSLFTLINQIIASPSDGFAQAREIITLVLRFGEKNPGMCRVIVGDGLVFENQALQQRMNQLLERIEAQLRQCYRQIIGAGQIKGNLNVSARAAVLMAFILGSLHRFTRSGYKKLPTEHLAASLDHLFADDPARSTANREILRRTS